MCFSLQTVRQLNHKMISSKVVKYIAQFKQQSIRSVERFNVLTRGWVWMLMDAVKETLKPDTAITAAAIAYFSLFSIFPITLLSIAIASFSLGSINGPSVHYSKAGVCCSSHGAVVGAKY
jgi:hypothetical protein